MKKLDCNEAKDCYGIDRQDRWNGTATEQNAWEEESEWWGGGLHLTPTHSVPKGYQQSLF